MKISVVKTFDELEAVRSYWEQWQDHANNDLAQFELVCQIRPEVLSPCVTIVEEDDRPLALLAGRLEQTVFAPTIGYLKPLTLNAKVLAVIHQGVVGTLDEKAAEQCVRSYSTLLGTGLADAIEFHHLREDSTLMRALLVHGSWWLRRKVPRWSSHRQMTLPNQGQFLEQKVRAKHRSQLRKKQKDLESDFRGRLSWRWLTRFDDIAGLCASLEEVAVKAYQRGLGAGFVDGKEYRERFALFASRGQLRVQLLEIDGKVRAFWFGTVYNGVYHSSETAYDPDLREYEVGTLAFIRMADELAREGVRRLDFGLGDAPYKERFGDSTWREASVWLFAPSAKGLALRATFEFATALDRAARGVLQRTGLSDRLKAIWRRRAAKSDAEPNRAQIGNEPAGTP